MHHFRNKWYIAMQLYAVLYSQNEKEVHKGTGEKNP